MHMRQLYRLYCDVIWLDCLFAVWLCQTARCIKCSPLTPFWVRVPVKKKKTVNEHVIEYNAIYYDDGIHVCIVFVFCVIFKCNSLLRYNIECIFWPVIRPGFFSVWMFLFKMDYFNWWRASHFDSERITNLEERTVFSSIISSWDK